MPLHLVQRGNNRGDCFWAARDRGLYLSLLAEFGDLYECSVHAYVLMTNHVHLLVTPGRSDSVALMMRRIGQRYVQYVNRKYARSGTLWEGRYHSSIIDSVEYLLRCQRYIELNPVRAGIVSRPSQYEWSSYGANALGKPSELVVPHAEYVALGATVDERAARYRQLVDELVPAPELDRIREAAKGGHALGRPAFIESIQAQLQRRIVHGGTGGRPRKAASV